VGVTTKMVKGWMGVWVVVRVGWVKLGWMGTRADDEGGMVQESAGVEQWVSLFIRFYFWHMGNGFARLIASSLVQGASGRLQRPAATLSSSQLQEPCISTPHIHPLRCASKRKLGTKCPIWSNQHHNAPPIRGIRGKTRSPQHPVNFSAP
jgi:hypothetical protein